MVCNQLASRSAYAGAYIVCVGTPGSKKTCKGDFPLEHKLKTYRADKMMYVNPIEESRLGREEFEKVDMSKYTVQHFGMFGGEMQNVVIVLSEKMIDVFVDRFGKDIRFSKTGDQKHPY